MSVKSVWRTHYRNGFRVNQELGMPYHLYCGLKATLMALPYGVFVSSLGQTGRGGGFFQAACGYSFASILRYTFISICKQERSLPCGFPRDNG